MRPRTTAAKKRRVRNKLERKLKKTTSRVMPMLSRPKKLKAVKAAAAKAKAAKAAPKPAAKAAAAK